MSCGTDPASNPNRYANPKFNICGGLLVYPACLVRLVLEKGTVYYATGQFYCERLWIWCMFCGSPLNLALSLSNGCLFCSWCGITDQCHNCGRSIFLIKRYMECCVQDSSENGAEAVSWVQTRSVWSLT